MSLCALVQKNTLMQYENTVHRIQIQQKLLVAIYSTSLRRIYVYETFFGGAGYAPNFLIKNVNAVVLYVFGEILRYMKF